jgi:hypothetical protein
MNYLLRMFPLALLGLPFLSSAQVQSAGAVGLEVPAPALPRHGHFLTGAYVSASYTPRLAAGAAGYAVQPYLRYVLGNSGTARPFVQYSFAPYWVRGYGPGAPLNGPGGAELPANAAFAPLPLRNPDGPGYGSFGNFSLGVPLRLGASPVMLHVAGSVLGSLVR